MIDILKSYRKILIWILAAMLIPVYTMADSKEYAIKAAFIYNFAKFVTWPGEHSLESSEELVIGVYGESDPFGETWNEITAKTVLGKAITVRQCNKDLNLASTCHILFIDGSNPTQMKNVIESLSDYPVLTIGDRPLFAENGGMIGFYKRDNKIRFAINLNQCKESGLVLSSRLLKLAEIVGTPNRQDVE